MAILVGMQLFFPVLICISLMINGISIFSYVYLPFDYIYKFFYWGVCSDLYFILIILFIYFWFWLCHGTCEILVPQPGMDHWIAREVPELFLILKSAVFVSCWVLRDLCVFWSPLSDMCFAKVFSLPVACLFILLTVSFVFHLKKSNSNFSFIDCAFGVVTKNCSSNPISHRSWVFFLLEAL